MDPERRAAALAQLPEEEAEPLGETLGILLATQRPMDRYVEALRGAVAHARAEGTGSVGSVGFCLGGGLSARLAAAEPALGAAVVFYGISPPAEQAAGIACPVLGIYGGEDARVNKTVEPFAEAMAEAGKSFDHHTYEGAAHAFFNDTRRVYNVAAARDAWARTLTFLAANLR
jgi:carboxymethylenebutenolidase